MPDIDAEMMVDQVVMLGWSRASSFARRQAEAEDGSPDTMLRMLLRKGCAHELADRPAQEGGPQRVFLRRLQGAFPPGGGDVRPGLSRRAYHDQGGPGDQGPPPAVCHDQRGGRTVSQGGRGRHAAATSQHRPDHRRGTAGSSALHDHGVCRGNEPARFHEAAHADPHRSRPCRSCWEWPEGCNIRWSGA